MWEVAQERGGKVEGGEEGERRLREERKRRGVGM